MEYIIAALMAGLSFLLNRLFMRYIGPVTIISLGPAAEEAAKTMFAYYLAAGIVTVHVVFGIIEALYDWFQDGARHIIAPLLSVTGHSLFGVVTAGSLTITGSIWAALAVGIVVHLVYNVTVVRLLAGKEAKNIRKKDNT